MLAVKINDVIIPIDHLSRDGCTVVRHPDDMLTGYKADIVNINENSNTVVLGKVLFHEITDVEKIDDGIYRTTYHTENGVA
jgi:hypothetical protein